MIVTTAVFEVSDVLASRLKGAGKPLASTVADEIKKAADEAKTKQDAADQAKANDAQNLPPTVKEATLFTVRGKPALTQSLIEQSRQQELVNLQLDALQPQLDQCVATAKL